MAPREADDDGNEIGPRLRALRKQRGLTLVQLSERAGLSAAFISQAERGLCQVSIPSLGRLADALGIDTYQLILPARVGPQRVEIDRSADRRSFPQTDDVAGPTATPLIGDGHQLRVVEVSGGSAETYGPFQHRNDEFFHVLEGRVEVTVDGQVDELHAGDSLVFSGGVAMSWRALDAATRVLVVVIADHLASDPSLPS